MADTTWKPDFTKANPWEGMPADYVGVATFIPTTLVAKPPWQDKVGAESLPAYGTPGYAILAKSIIDDLYSEAISKTGATQQKAIDLLTYAKKAAEAGAGIASANIGLTPAIVPTITPTPSLVAEKEQPNWLLWGGLGLLALMVLMPKKKLAV